jgi:hypothetical protein
MIKTTRSYVGDVLMCSRAIAKLVPTEWHEFTVAENEANLEYEDDYKRLVSDVNGKQLPSRYANSRLVKAARDVVAAVAAKGIQLVVGYIFNEVEATVVFGFNYQVIDYSLKQSEVQRFESLGLDIDAIYMDSTSYLPN